MYRWADHLNWDHFATATFVAELAAVARNPRPELRSAAASLPTPRTSTSPAAGLPLIPAANLPGLVGEATSHPTPHTPSTNRCSPPHTSELISADHARPILDPFRDLPPPQDPNAALPGGPYALTRRICQEEAERVRGMRFGTRPEDHEALLARCGPSLDRWLQLLDAGLIVFDADKAREPVETGGTMRS
jgi:hypothetical protein